MKFSLRRFLAMVGLTLLILAAAVGVAALGAALGIAVGGWWVVGRW